MGGANKLQRGMESRGSPRGGHEPAREKEERLLTFPSPFPWGGASGASAEMEMKWPGKKEERRGRKGEGERL